MFKNSLGLKNEGLGDNSKISVNSNYTGELFSNKDTIQKRREA